ncbi:double-strand break repair protein AddB [Govanella unica]|uniref:Double-strand break repair protein AddB n=1 Tax=Govanella unica TaxID=2975056 RepID=A0A9X3TZG2_9PROT|nr:double-strand break repair protein AddB [Govania unica]MDA5194575.1 double-strand break repair protein AddB [Govania unica]
MSRTLRATPQVFRIDAGLSFVDALAAGLLARYAGAELGRVTVLLPTRRAVKSLSEAFLRLTGGVPLILPVMRPIGDVEEDELLFNPALAETDLTLPPAVPPLWRQLMLTRLVEAFAKRHADGAGSTAQAVELAAALAKFLDEVTVEGRDFADLATVVPANFASHWQETLTFLEIVSRDWPQIVAEQGFMDAAERRNRLLQALATIWQADPPGDPVIAAGSTGNIPAAAALMATVARLPEGAVVLPAFDREMEDASWDMLGPTHPQAAMKKLIEDEIGIVRHEVMDWLTPEDAARLPQGPAARRDLLKEALRPAETTAAWREVALDWDQALARFSRIDAPSPREEAGAIALLMREALETPDRTAALVTPDRGLARRVAAELKRWDILVDDSAGAALAESGPGVFLLLLAELAAQDFAPVSLLGVLKHPLAAGGRSMAQFRAEVRALEIAVLRGPRPSGGADGIARAVKALDDEVLRDRLAGWWQGLSEGLAEFVALVTGGGSLRDLAAAHVAAAERLAASADRSGPARLWAGEAGEAAAAFSEELLDGGQDFAIPAGEYPAVLKALMIGKVVRPRYGRHPRLHIWGALEARLQHADLVILGGLNEGVWPPDAGIDPWLSRPMRAAFGLPPMERRIGLSAHDFYVAATAPEVVLTRSEKSDGAPTVPSRWLMRMDAVLQDRRLPAHPALDWFAGLDRPAEIAPARPPEPRPPLDARPKRLSVTQIGTWMRDPYAIYARHILRLKALDPLDADPGAADKGNIIHAALDRFVNEYPITLPPDALDRLIAIGRDEFGRNLTRPTVRAFWWPRFQHVAEWFIATERDRRALYTTVLNEGRGDYILESPFDFKLTAKADRIDRGPGGTLTIIDYKTGQPPEDRQIVAGYQPQMPLEAMMAEAGAFKGLPAAAVTGLEFWRLHGGEPAGTMKPMKDVEDRKAQAARGLRELVALFDKPETPYRSTMRPEEVTAGDYDHLARIKEWSGVGSLVGRDKTEDDA